MAVIEVLTRSGCLEECIVLRASEGSRNAQKTSYSRGSRNALERRMGKDDEKPWVWVLDERADDSWRWLDELEQHFSVKRIVSVIGTHRHEGVLAAVVLRLTPPETRAGTLIGLLRGQRAMDTVPIYVLATAPIEGVSQALSSLSAVEVMDVARAPLFLRARISAGWTGSRRAPENPGTSSPNLVPAVAAAAGTPHERLQKRFLVHSAERGQRALALCTELQHPGLTDVKRRALLEEVKDLLNMMKGEATMLRLRAVADVLTTAEGIVARIDEKRRGGIPTEVVGLFNDLAGLGAAGASIRSLDLEFHRLRLSSTEESDGRARSPN
jgi:hypothetical protein